VAVRTSRDPAERAAAVRRRLAFDTDPDAALAGADVAAAEAELRRRLGRARPAALPDEVIEGVSSLCAAVGAEGLRADLTICRAAAALAGWEGRATVAAADVRRVAPLALVHRARRDPLEPAGLDEQRLAQALDDYVGGGKSEAAASRPADPEDEDSGPDGRPRPVPSRPGEPVGRGQSGPARPADPSLAPVPVDPSLAPVPADPSLAPVPLPVPAGSPETTSSAASGEQPEVDAGPLRPPPQAIGASRGRGPGTPSPGRRAPAEAPRGRLIGDRTPNGPVGSVAVSATVRYAAARAAGAGPDPAPGAPLVGPEDVREAIRVDRAASLIVLAVDASGSMGAPQRMEAAKGAVLGLLTDAYQRRDLVGLVAFRGDDAQVLLRPTGSVEVARARLAALPTGGRTPLAAGITTALHLATTPARAATHRPVLVLVTDGRATSAPAGADPVAAASAAADTVRRAGVEAVVIDVEDTAGAGGPRRAPGLGLGRALATRMGGRHVPLISLTPGGLHRIVREQAAWG
jgi:magnesium chelatase subunit D